MRKCCQVYAEAYAGQLHKETKSQRHRNTETQRQRDTETQRQSDTQTHTNTGRHTKTQRHTTNRQTHTHTHKHKQRKATTPPHKQSIAKSPPVFVWSPGASPKPRTAKAQAVKQNEQSTLGVIASVCAPPAHLSRAATRTNTDLASPTPMVTEAQKRTSAEAQG